MLWISLIVLFLFFFAGLMFFLWYVLKRNYDSATERLQALSKDVVAKEEEANRVLQNAQKEAKGLIAKETQAAQEKKEQIIKEAQGQKEHILQEANQRSAEITKKAQKNAEFIQNNLEQKINERAKELAVSLIHSTIPKEFLKDVHAKWVDDSDRGEFNLKHLKLPEKVKEAKIVSAFPLTDKQQNELKVKLKKKIGSEITLKRETDSSLIAGFVISIGSVVVDASLKYKIQKAIQN